MALNTGGYFDATAETMVAYRTTGNCGAWETGDRIDALCTSTDPNGTVLAFAKNQEGTVTEGDVMQTIGADCGHASARPSPKVRGPFGVRRLTPRECERLQGFPEDWTRWGANGKEISDSARYRMLGNAVSVPVSRWIGRRIMEAAT